MSTLALSRSSSHGRRLRVLELATGAITGVRDGLRIARHFNALNSLSDAERLLKHEGFHWAVGGKLRVEYGQLVAAIGRKIPTDGMQEIITLLVFSVFSVLYLGSAIRWNHVVGFALLVAAAFFLFRD